MVVHYHHGTQHSCALFFRKNLFKIIINFELFFRGVEKKLVGDGPGAGLDVSESPRHPTDNLTCSCLIRKKKKEKRKTKKKKRKIVAAAERNLRGCVCVCVYDGRAGGGQAALPEQSTRWKLFLLLLLLHFTSAAERRAL